MVERRYSVIEQIDVGGMAEVWRGKERLGIARGQLATKEAPIGPRWREVHEPARERRCEEGG